MAEKEIAQRKAAGQESEHEGGKSMNPPAFQLITSDDGDGNGTSGGGSGGGGTIQKKDAKGFEGTDKTAKDALGGYTTHVGSSAIVTVPKAANGALPIVVVIGGLYYATREWMKQEMPSNFFDTHILAFANHGTLYQKGIKPEIEAAMAKGGAKGYYKALLGFSKGGERIEAAKNDEKWSFLGMIDPVVTLGATYPCPAYMVWTKWKAKGDPREALHQRILNGEVAGQSIAGGSVANHPKMPALWFSSYGSML